ncbi:MAG: MmgE/PrpD family protein [Thermodesulfobacteriota bacterium]|nr:MmgE/PrpD family protein [Thermodesulfobacteriota bacterium]
MENVTMKLAEFISQLTFDKIPGGAIKKAKASLLDSLGCAFSGSTTQCSKIVNHFVQSQKGVREASLWTTSFLGPAANVVLANGTMIHSFDFDDYHMTKIHPGAAVIPAAMAVGEKEKIDGKRLITAVVAGYETMTHLSRGLNPGASRLKGWHLTGTCGTFAAAAALGNIWQFDPMTMSNALGMAGTQSSGLWAFTADGSESKRFHPGRAAQSGVIAAILARKGYRGPTKILEAEDGGFYKATSEDFNFSKTLEGLGEKFDIEDVAIKPYPACASLHSSVDAALILRKENEIPLDQIKEIQVHNSELVNVQCGFEYRPMGALQAQMSMQYCMARIMIDGELSMAQFTEEKLSDPAAIELTQRVRFFLDEEINMIYPREFPSVVEIIMKDGKNYRQRVNMPKGSVANPMTWLDVQKKFEKHALQVVPEKKANAIIEMIDHLERVSDVGEIPKQMKP